ncbi:MAG: zinc-ribbon domain-containing protein [bacterium]|nr:zinc-ribbon domain-containing protein [bacterium]
MLRRHRSCARRGKRAALAVMASGLGKTVTAAFDLKTWLSENKGRVLYLSHQNDILTQAQDTFREVLGSGYQYGFFTGLEKSAHRADIVFASLQTMRKHHKSFRPDEFSYIIFDESHHTPASSYLEVVKYFTPKFLVGLTATPDRRDGQNIRSLYGDEVFYLPLEEALVRSLVTPVDYRLMGDEISLEELGASRVWNSTAELQTLFVPKRDEEVAALIAKHAVELTLPRMIIFASTILRADQLTKSIPGSVAIHSRAPIKERLVRMELFRLGLIPTVITVDCFNEGVDIPQANLIVFLRSTASPVVFFQQLGRGLRRAEGKEKVIVLDFVGNCERITMLKDLSDAIEHRRREYHKRAGVETPSDAKASETSIRFDERVVQVLDVIKRIRRQRIADVPEIAQEYGARNPVTASFLAVKSREVVWWKCGECGYEYEMSPKQRLLGDGCPQCRDRNATATNNLTVTHAFLAREYDSENSLPVTKVRAISCQLVWWKCSECGYKWRTRPKNRTEQGYNCPSCSALIAFYKNNLGIKAPHLAEEYSYRNILAPNRFNWRSTKKVWWICNECGYEWMALGWGRSSDRCGCPVCTPKQATKENNLVAAHPYLAEEYSSRNRKPVEAVFAGTPDKFWWVCGVCGRYWEATIKERMDGKRCPTCVRSIPVSVST